MITKRSIDTSPDNVGQTLASVGKRGQAWASLGLMSSDTETSEDHVEHI